MRALCTGNKLCVFPWPVIYFLVVNNGGTNTKRCLVFYDPSLVGLWAVPEHVMQVQALEVKLFVLSERGSRSNLEVGWGCHGALSRLGICSVLALNKTWVEEFLFVLCVCVQRMEASNHLFIEHQGPPPWSLHACLVSSHMPLCLACEVAKFLSASSFV